MAAVAAAVVTGVTGGPATAAGQGGGTQVSCSTAALTAAIATASAGGTLSLHRGCIYHLTTEYSAGDGLPIIAQSLTIRGNGATIVRDGPTAGLFRIFHVTSTGNLRLEDLTVRGGSASGNGGGIRVDNGGKLTLVHVCVRDNTATGNGGGVWADAGAAAVVRRSWLAFNNAMNGGGLFTSGTLNVEDSEFSRNHARASGGGFIQLGGNGYVRTTLIRRNTSADSGGGVYTGNGGTMEISESKIANNTSAGRFGGGIANSEQLTLEKTEVKGNVVGGSDGLGGGIYNVTSDGVLILRGSKVTSNSANGNGTAHGGGIYNNLGTVTLDHSTVRDNASTTAPGGVFTNTPVTVMASQVTHNIPTNCSPGLVPGCVN
ncbi:right-handed parallel beta-helix repeat-containing protein [Streptomyces shenzhenensis]|uniref:right-handed parallel beta-helix repeat-containing protein n=1 Tax=Streptomyces shenzhenensis TaxID=943815 RepID=UPI0015F0A2F9|nr:right-handed parallel beta-helix repeat-containing protein [Streptomyces shenzhenensis]